MPVTGWPTDLTVEGITDQEILDDAARMATSILYALSGRRFGERTTVVRPCSTSQDTRGASYLDAVWPFSPWNTPGTVAYYACCRTHWTGVAAIPPPCGCGTLHELVLPRTPVTRILAVTLDGVTLDESEYRLIKPRWLVREDGTEWPATQDLTLPLTEVGTFGIDIRYGHKVPPGGKIAHRLYATELAKALSNESCALPDRAVAVTRRGVEVRIDPKEFLDDGRTGIGVVDSWLRSVNPNRLQRNSRVHRPDAVTAGRLGRRAPI